MKKIKININRPKPESGQIASQMDFDGVMRGYRGHKKGAWIKKPFLLLFAALLLLFSAVFVLKKDKVDSSQLQAAVAPAVTVRDSSKGSVIKPLIPGMEINESNFHCSAEKGDTLRTAAGAQIIVPANAFVDRNGRTIKDSVTIRFREFYDPIDFACSGIPMTYDSAGRTWIFESSGMCEIQGFQNGKPVHINMATPLSISMPTKFGKNDPNLYILDSTTGVWTYIGKPSVTADMVERKAPVDENVVKLDVADLSYQPAEKEAITSPVIRKLDEEISALESEKSGLREPGKPKKIRKNRHNFTIDVKESEFPELGSYKEVVFEVSEENKEFSEDYYKYEWNNTELREIEPGKKYKLILEREYQSDKVDDTERPVPMRLELIVSPVLNEADYAKAMETFKQKFEEYKTKKIENERQLAELKKKREEEIKDRLIAREKVREEARKKAYEAYQASLDDLNEGNIYVSFQADKFAIYNCDRPVTYKNPARIVADFTDPNGRSLAINTMYQMRFADNSMFLNYYNSCCNNSLAYQKGTENMLFAVLRDHRIAWLSKEEFSKLPTQGRAQIRLAVSDKSFEKVSDMKKHIGL